MSEPSLPAPVKRKCIPAVEKQEQGPVKAEWSGMFQFHQTFFKISEKHNFEVSRAASLLGLLGQLGRGGGSAQGERQPQAADEPPGLAVLLPLCSGSPFSKESLLDLSRTGWPLLCSRGPFHLDDTIGNSPGKMLGLVKVPTLYLQIQDNWVLFIIFSPILRKFWLPPARFG